MSQIVDGGEMRGDISTTANGSTHSARAYVATRLTAAIRPPNEQAARGEHLRLCCVAAARAASVGSWPEAATGAGVAGQMVETKSLAIPDATQT